MSIGILLLIAAAAAGAVIYLLTYVPLLGSFAGRTYSPRLLVCRILAPFDATVTLLLIAGGWFGVSTMITGINMAIMNILTGVGISVGVAIVRKLMIPMWKKRYDVEVALRAQTRLTSKHAISGRPNRK